MTLKNSAEDLINNYGREIVFIRKKGATFDPVTGIETAGTTSRTKARAIIGKFSSKEVDGTLIKAGDKLITFMGFTPELGDSVEIDRAEYSVPFIDAIAPSGTVLYYRAGIRA
jgi:hypothetical protein